MNAYELLQRPVCLLDFETTGLDPATDRVIEAAAIRIDQNGRQELSEIVCPCPPVKVSEFNVQHGITQEMVDNGTPDLEVFERLRELVTGAVIIGHNVPFDLSFLDAELRRLGMQPWRGDFACTRALATFLRVGTRERNKRGEEYLSVTLASVCKVLDIPLEGAHRALNDLEATEKALLKLWPMCLNEFRPTMNAMVRPEWVEQQIREGRRAPEYTPPRAILYLTA